MFGISMDSESSQKIQTCKCGKQCQHFQQHLYCKATQIRAERQHCISTVASMFEHLNVNQHRRAEVSLSKTLTVYLLLLYYLLLKCQNIKMREKIKYH